MTSGLPQGSPLLPDDLRMVAAPAAAATIVVSDSSRCGAAALPGQELLRHPCP